MLVHFQLLLIVPLTVALTSLAACQQEPAPFADGQPDGIEAADTLRSPGPPRPPGIPSGDLQEPPPPPSDPGAPMGPPPPLPPHLRGAEAQPSPRGSATLRITESQEHGQDEIVGVLHVTPSEAYFEDGGTRIPLIGGSMVMSMGAREMTARTAQALRDLAGQRVVARGELQGSVLWEAQVQAVR